MRLEKLNMPAEAVLFASFRGGRSGLPALGQARLRAMPFVRFVEVDCDRNAAKSLLLLRVQVNAEKLLTALMLVNFPSFPSAHFE